MIGPYPSARERKYLQRWMNSDLYRTLVETRSEGLNETFHCHKELLCHESKLFAKQFGRGKGNITVKGLDSRTMRMFLLWLYTGELVPLFSSE